MTQIIGQIREYFFTYQFGTMPEAYGIIKDILSDNVFVVIFEQKSEPEKLNATHYEDLFYSIKVTDDDLHTVFDEEMLDTLPYVIQDEFSGFINKPLIMVSDWEIVSDLDIFMF